MNKYIKKFSDEDIKEIRQNYNQDKESKKQYCVRIANKYNMSEAMIRHILNNKKYYDPNYEPYMPGKILKVNQNIVNKIRQEYINRNKCIGYEEFIYEKQIQYNVSEHTIRDILYNRTWKDDMYKAPGNIQSIYLDFDNKKDEIWKGLIYNDEDYSDLYKVSNYGRIYDIVNNKIKGYSYNKGYYQCTVQIYGVYKLLAVHRAVACTFISNPNNKPEVNHKDGIRDNNYVGTSEHNFTDGNLEWVTSSENTIHAYKTGLNKSRKLSDDQVRYIRQVYIPKDKQYGIPALAQKFNVGTNCISNVVNYKTYKYVE